MKNIFAINGSASQNSSNEKLISRFGELGRECFRLTLCPELKKLPQFDPQLSFDDVPPEIEAFRKGISNADGILICTPEYLFSIPSGLKNAIEWCVATTIFSGKPIALITASASGTKGHNELKLIMKTLMAAYSSGTTLLIKGVKEKINETGEITHRDVQRSLSVLVKNFIKELYGVAAGT